ncbi:LytR/AlgR family response regulator transcription factor [Zunongwangia profunda]|nr:LytTR family DNA-binding domain-containing protein [Zunongwangia profunda]|tara:strand:- start:865 stop:1482 length:618 start_codon:yes stop_codon:yes gene_type:complete
MIQEVFGEYDDYHCVGLSESFEKSMNPILKYHPDILFINVDQQCCNGSPYSFCKEVQEFSGKEILFVALSVEMLKAYMAIKNKFYDFLLKPGEEAELRKTALGILLNKERENSEKTICLKSYKDYTLIKTNDIIYLEADNNTTDFVLCDNRRISAFKTLKTFEDALSENFVRIHHKYIVNSKYISKISFGKQICILSTKTKDISP